MDLHGMSFPDSRIVLQLWIEGIVQYQGEADGGTEDEEVRWMADEAPWLQGKLQDVKW